MAANLTIDSRDVEPMKTMRSTAPRLSERPPFCRASVALTCPIGRVATFGAHGVPNGGSVAARWPLDRAARPRVHAAASWGNQQGPPDSEHSVHHGSRRAKVKSLNVCRRPAEGLPHGQLWGSLWGSWRNGFKITIHDRHLASHSKFRCRTSSSFSGGPMGSPRLSQPTV